MDMLESAFHQVVDAFDVSQANKYYTSTFTGITELPVKTKGGSIVNRRCFAFSHHSKLAVLWSHVSNKDLFEAQSWINAIVLGTDDLIPGFKDELGGQWEAKTTIHPMFPLVICTLVLSKDISSKHITIDNDLKTVEARTGYHRFTRRSVTAATEDLGELSARTSGSEAKLAGITRKLKALRIMFDFISNNTQSDPEKHSSHETDMSGEEIIHHGVNLIKKRVEMQTIENEYILHRVRIQVEAVCGPY